VSAQDFSQSARLMEEAEADGESLAPGLVDRVLVVTEGESFRMREARSRGGDRPKK